jgi:NADH:ubiquinone oxidoreductase subunit 6 (subunit J)
MNETVAHVERILAFIGGIVVFVVAAIALRNDWRAKGLENQVFKLMLALLALGAILAVMASVNFLAGKGVEI